MKTVFLLFFVSYFPLSWAGSCEGVGEKNFSEYFGPRDPQQSFSRLKGTLHFSDQDINDSYYMPYVESEVNLLNSFWNETFMPSASCPKVVLDRNFEYIRYLYRLQAISYSFEAINKLEKLRFNLTGKSGRCARNWKNLFSDCSPKSSDMKLFLKRVSVLLKKKFSETRKHPDRYEMRALKDKKVRELTGKVGGVDNKILRTVFNHYNATPRKENLVQIIDKSCGELIEMNRRLCSERDDFYAGNDLYFFSVLLLNSNATNALKESNSAAACLERFSRTSHFKSTTFPLFEKIFPYIYLDMREKHAQYLQGSLFLPGALKEFDDLGLKDFLFTEKPKPKPTPKPVVVVKPKSTPKPVVVVKPKPTPKPVVVVVKPTPTPKPIWEDHFYQAVKQQRLTGAKSVVVDLSGLVEDYPFTPKMVRKIAAPLKIYQRVKSLQQMKKYDQMGSKKTPVILSFMLYMIAYQQHQGLFNMTMVLGNEFYVINNFDKKHSESVRVKLLNDESTNFQWQLAVIKEKTPTNVGAGGKR